MFQLLLLTLKIRKYSALRIGGALFMFIASMLLIFLNLASYKPSKAFSGIYLVQVSSNTTSTLGAGYYRMCETPLKGMAVNGTVSTVCKPLGHFKGSGLAYDFSESVVRPYFLVIATVTAIIGFLLCTALTVSAGARFAQLELATSVVTYITLASGIIAACWQQVAVQAAVVMIPQEVKRCHRAAGLVWSAVALISVTVCSQYFISLDEKECPAHDEQDYPTSSGSELSSVAEKTYGAGPYGVGHLNP